MQIDSALLAILITVLGAIIAIAYGYGILTQKVKSNRIDFDAKVKQHDMDIADIYKNFKEYRDENKADHREMNTKLDKILQNGS